MKTLAASPRQTALNPPLPSIARCAGSKGGFTLVELISASFVGMMLIAMFMTAFLQQRRVYRKEQLINEMQQNARYAVEAVARDIRMAGYGLSVPSHRLSSWVSWVPNFTLNPQLIQGSGTAPDRLTIVGAFSAPVARLSAAAAKGGSTLDLTMLNGRTADATFGPSDRKVLYVGKTETVRVTAINNNQITVSSDPVSAKGLAFAYAAGTPVELVSTVDYEIRDGNNWLSDFPYLARIDSLSEYAFFRTGDNNLFGRGGDEMFMVTAGYIEDFQVVRTLGGLRVTVTARTSQPDNTYTHPTRNDPFRRLTMNSLVRPRNR